MMKKNSEKIKDSNGNYEVNKGYKCISGGNADEAFALIASQIEQIKRGSYMKSDRESYRVPSHKKAFDCEEYEKQKKKTPFRKEEWICKHCIGRDFLSVGKIVDYQVPLKRKRSKEYEGLGKIDLLSQKGKDAYLLEVKIPNSTEEPLRAIMEVYTYWQQLGGNKCQNFLDNSMLKDATTLKKAIVLYEDSPIYNKLYKKLTDPSDKMRWLMKELDVECFVAEPINCDDGLIKDIVECKL